MMRFMWDPKYSVGIKSIDKQHQKFFEIINNIYFLADNRYSEPDKDKLLKEVKELTDYAETHLKFEEKYFAEFDYEEAEEHIKAHDAFRKYIKECLLKINDPKNDVVNLANEMAEFCKNWLSAHILDMDHKYISLFLSNGL